LRKETYRAELPIRKNNIPREKGLYSEIVNDSRETFPLSKKIGNKNS